MLIGQKSSTSALNAGCVQYYSTMDRVQSCHVLMDSRCSSISSVSCLQIAKRQNKHQLTSKLAVGALLSFDCSQSMWSLYSHSLIWVCFVLYMVIGIVIYILYLVLLSVLFSFTERIAVRGRSVLLFPD